MAYLIRELRMYLPWNSGESTLSIYDRGVLVFKRKLCLPFNCININVVEPEIVITYRSKEDFFRLPEDYGIMRFVEWTNRRTVFALWYDHNCYDVDSDNLKFMSMYSVKLDASFRTEKLRQQIKWKSTFFKFFTYDIRKDEFESVLSVRKQHLLEDTISGFKDKFNPWHFRVQFNDECYYDIRDARKDMKTWFYALCEELRNSECMMFTSGDCYDLLPDLPKHGKLKATGVKPPFRRTVFPEDELLAHSYLIGILVGVSMIYNLQLPFTFSVGFLEALLHREWTFYHCNRTIQDLIVLHKEGNIKKEVQRYFNRQTYKAALKGFQFVFFYIKAFSVEKQGPIHGYRHLLENMDTRSLFLLLKEVDYTPSMVFDMLDLSGVREQEIRFLWEILNEFNPDQLKHFVRYIGGEIRPGLEVLVRRIDNDLQIRTSSPNTLEIQYYDNVKDFKVKMVEAMYKHDKLYRRDASLRLTF